MATRDEIKKAILGAVGNPSAGVIADNAERMADAVIALDAPKAAREFDQRETRKVEPKETR